MPLYDCLVIGGGPTGLSAALGLSRALRTCVVFDDGSYRNAPATHMHTVPTWDHQDPGAWRASAIAELLNGRYSSVSQISPSPIVKASKTLYNPRRPDSHYYFTLTDRNGIEWHGKTVIFASGVRDYVDDIPGFRDAWGESIFHCLFCHGFEERGAESAGILVLSRPLWSYVHVFAGQTAHLAKKITIYANGFAKDDCNEKVAQILKANEFRIEPRKIIKLETAKYKSLNGTHREPERTKTTGSKTAEPPTSIKIWFEGNETDEADATENFLVTKPDLEVRNKNLMESIGVRMAPPYGFVDVSAANFLSTTVPGAYAAGDNTSSVQTVTSAICEGTLASAGVHHYIITNDLEAGKFRTSKSVKSVP